MKPASFDESNQILSRPKDMTDTECDPLSVFRNGNVVISCWKMTKEEKQEFERTGRIWLIVHGSNMPPVLLTATKPFRKS